MSKRARAMWRWVKHFRPGKWSLAGVVAALIMVAVGWLSYYLHQPPELVHHLGNLKVKKPMAVSFTRPIRGDVRYRVVPAVAGSWQVSQNWFGITGLAFVPARPLVPGSTYDLKLERIAPVLSTKPAIAAATIPVTVEKPAAIAAVSPGPNAVNVAVGTDITVRLAGPNGGLRRLALSGDVPLASAAPASRDDTLFTWKLAAPLRQGTAYHLTLSDLNQSSPDKQALLATSFTTVPEPHITQATSQDHFYPGTSIIVGFDQDMMPAETAFRFGMSGSGKWISSRLYQFMPTGLAPGRTYSYTVVAGATSTTDGVVESDHSFAVSTPGAVVVTGFSPGGSNVSVSAAVSVTFDQPVNHPGAEAAFHMVPAAPGSFSWSGNTLTFHPASLGYQTTYQVSIAAGVTPIFGLPSAQVFTHSFATTYQVIKLNVPQYLQIYAQSCEESALRMALAYYGIAASDYDILLRVGYNPRPRDTVTNSWDNPYDMFVGDVSGVQNTTGYGVFAPPIARAAQSYGRGATVAINVSAGYIAQQIYEGHPVLAWGYSKNLLVDGWNVPGGGSVATYRGEHVRVVYGVAGSPGNVIGFYLHDPVYGSLYWTPAQLMANMNVLGAMSNQTVTVY